MSARVRARGRGRGGAVSPQHRGPVRLVRRRRAQHPRLGAGRAASRWTSWPATSATADVAAIGVELLDALAYAHSQGIIHRDVKPQNVMLDDDGHVKVMDFGIARLMDADTLTQDGDVIGTVAYMSPEQAAGASRADRRATCTPRAWCCTSCWPASTRCAGRRRPRRCPTWPPAGCRRWARCGPTCRTIWSGSSTTPARRGRGSGRRPPSSATALRRAAAQRAPAARTGAARASGWCVRCSRAGAVAERAGGAGLAAVTSGVVLGALPAYPQSWTLPLRRALHGGLGGGAAGRARLPARRAGVPRLQRVAQPRRGVSGLRRRAVPPDPRAARRRALAGAGAGARAALSHAAGAGRGGSSGPRARPAGRRLGRRRHAPLPAPACAPLRGPFTLFQPRWRFADGPPRRAIRSRGGARLLAGGSWRPPCLLQMVVWAGLAVALGFAFRAAASSSVSGSGRCAFAGVVRRLPRRARIVVWGVPGDALPLLLGMWRWRPAVILLPLVLTTGDVPEERDDGHLQES